MRLTPWIQCVVWRSTLSHPPISGPFVWKNVFTSPSVAYAARYKLWLVLKVAGFPRNKNGTGIEWVFMCGILLFCLNRKKNRQLWLWLLFNFAIIINGNASICLSSISWQGLAAFNSCLGDGMNFKSLSVSHLSCRLPPCVITGITFIAGTNLHIVSWMKEARKIP